MAPVRLGSVLSGQDERTADQSGLACSGFPKQHNKYVYINTYVVYTVNLNSNQFRRWLSRQGCTFDTHKGGSGHLTVRLGDRTSQLPMHGGRRELGRRLIAKIKKDLGLD